MTTFTIDKEIVGKFPEILVGVFRVEGLERASSALKNVDSLMQEATTTLQQAGLNVENVSNEPRIKDWRDAYSKSGLKPSTFKSSAEQLARRLLKGQGISTPIPIVTAYCAVSAKHLAPMGGYDVERLPGQSIALRLGNPQSDKFTPLTGKAEEMPITPSVPVYAIGPEVICWAFNFRDSANTCLTEATKNAVFFSEAVTTQQQEAAKNGLLELKNLLSTSGAITSEVKFASAQNPDLEL